KGLYVVFFPYDTTRAKIDFLEELYTEVVEKANPDSVAIIDTIGCALPQTMYWLVKKVKSWIDLPVEVHTHNDFGMATATTLAAVEAGAEVVHGCLTGLGERTGNASLEQIAIGLKILLGVEVNIDFKSLVKVCKRVSELSKVQIPINKPVIGDVAYAREIGLGAKLFNKAPTTIFPLNPDFLNRHPKIVLGKKSGKESVIVKLDELGLKVDENLLPQLINEVKTFGINKGTYLTNDEFQLIVKKMIN
ncbi:MAG: LeuA family protein, partial [Promethearchaeota archaeon]